MGPFSPEASGSEAAWASRDIDIPAPRCWAARSPHARRNEPPSAPEARVQRLTGLMIRAKPSPYPLRAAIIGWTST